MLTKAGNRASELLPWAALCVLLAVECAPFWMLRFPSQDGPSHLHSVCILADYGKQPIYRAYYEIHFSIAGNLLTQALSAGLYQLAGPLVAERLLLTSYVILLPLSVWYALRPLTRHGFAFSLFAFLFLPNYFLHLGFWNFCLSIPLLFFTLGYWLRHRDRWTFGCVAIFAGLGFAIYLAHLLTWVLFAEGVVVLEAARWGARYERGGVTSAPEARAGDWKHGLGRSLFALCTLIPPAFLTAAYAVTATTGAREALSPAGDTLRAHLWSVYSLSFLYTVSDSDHIFAKVIAGLMALMFLAAVGLRVWRARSLRISDSFLLLSVLYTAMAALGPDAVGDGTYIRAREGLFAVLFLVVWLGAQDWPRFVPGACSALACALALCSLWARLPAYQRWDSLISEFQDAGRAIAPGSTILPLRTRADRDRVQPLLHGIDLFAPRPFVDLANYEAATDHFTTRFRAERSPFDALGPRAGLLHSDVQAAFDIRRYETETRGCVDYVVLYQQPHLDRDAAPGTDWTDAYLAQLRDYQLVYVSEPRLNLRVYRRPADVHTSGCTAGTR